MGCRHLIIIKIKNIVLGGKKVTSGIAGDRTSQSTRAAWLMLAVRSATVRNGRTGGESADPRWSVERTENGLGQPWLRGTEACRVFRATQACRSAFFREEKRAQGAPWATHSFSPLPCKLNADSVRSNSNLFVTLTAYKCLVKGSWVVGVKQRDNGPLLANLNSSIEINVNFGSLVSAS